MEEVRNGKMHWIALRVYRGDWKTPSVVMVGGLSRATAEIQLNEAGYHVLPDTLDVAVLVNGPDRKMILLGAPVNPTLRKKVKQTRPKCSSCGTQLSNEAIASGYRQCRKCHGEGNA